MMREDKDSLVEMLAKIPVTETRGSLLSAIERLLRVIDISESSIMIPTLLKDKCEFDAYEMLTLAKILKASILGHNDLVEFYMSESSSQLNCSLAQSQQLKQNQLLHQQLQLQSPSPSLRSSLSASTSTSTSSRSTPLPHLMEISTLHHHNHHHHHNGSSSITTSCSLNRTTNAQTTIDGLKNGDPDTTVRLLLQIEQLKTFIPHVTSLFESIIELYKNSVDTITH